MSLIQIIQGNANYYLGINTDLAKEREERACKNCFASHNDKGEYTGKCRKELGGCGCPVKKASRVAAKPCPLGVFHWDFISINRLEKINKKNNAYIY